MANSQKLTQNKNEDFWRKMDGGWLAILFTQQLYRAPILCKKWAGGDQGQTMKNDPNKDLYITEQYCWTEE